ncbi:hypothetical protein D3C78_1047730 [compost metagenome]
MAGHGLIGEGVGNVQVNGLAHYAVELAAKLQLAAKQALVEAEIRRRIMGEVDADGVPVAADADLGGAEAIHDAYRQLGDLA